MRSNPSEPLVGPKDGWVLVIQKGLQVSVCRQIPAVSGLAPRQAQQTEDFFHELAVRVIAQQPTILPFLPRVWMKALFGQPLSKKLEHATD